MKLLLICCVIASTWHSSLWDEIKDFMDGRLFSPQLLKQFLLPNVQYVRKMSNNYILPAPTPPPPCFESSSAPPTVKGAQSRVVSPQ